MTREVFTATIGTVAPSFGRAAEPNAAITAAVALQPDPTAFEAALATLVADGASPTQAHVTAVNDAYTALAAAQTAYVAAVTGLSGSVSADISVLVNCAAVLTRKKFNEAMQGLLQLINGQRSILTD